MFTFHNMYLQESIQQEPSLLTAWLMKPGGSITHSQGLCINLYSEEPNQSSSLIDIYFFKIHSNIVLYAQAFFPVSLPVSTIAHNTTLLYYAILHAIAALSPPVNNQ